MSKYLSCAETAKLIRGALKMRFPGQKFSVRSHTYAGGASINVSWTDGPAARTVDNVVNQFAGGRFDGMTDLAYCASHWYCPTHGSATANIYGNSYDAESVGVGVGNGPVESRCCALAEHVHFGSDYVFTHRDVSETAKALAAEVARKNLDQEYPADYLSGSAWISGCLPSGHWLEGTFAMLTRATAEDLAEIADQEGVPA